MIELLMKHRARCHQAYQTPATTREPLTQARGLCTIAKSQSFRLGACWSGLTTCEVIVNELWNDLYSDQDGTTCYAASYDSLRELFTPV